MTIEVKITNLDQSENPDKVAVVRTYHDKGNSVDDGIAIGPGESHTAYVHDESFVQVDEASNPDYVAPAPVYVEPEPDQSSDDDDEGSTPERVEQIIEQVNEANGVVPATQEELEVQADAEAAASREARGVTKEEDEAALAAEVAEADDNEEADEDESDDIDALLS